MFTGTGGRGSSDASSGGGRGGIDAAIVVPATDGGALLEPEASDASPDGRTSPVDPLVGSYDIYGNEGDSARLDIRKTSTGYEAIITPDGGHPASVSMTITDTSVHLSGSIVLPPGQCGVFGWTWTSVTIPRLPDGSLGSHPTLTASGPNYSYSDPCCEYVDNIPAPGGPFLLRDTTPPRLSLGTMPTNVPPGQLLPWDSIPIGVSEGVPASKVLASLSLVEVPSASPVGGISWNVSASPVELAWDAIVRVEAVASSWDAVAGKKVQVVAAPGVPDLAGNLSSASRLSAVTFADVGPPRARFDLDAPAVLATWGTARLAAAGTPDADVCEAGGCALVGPFGGYDGIAGRLATSGAVSEVHIRFRLLSVSEVVPGSSAPPWMPLVEVVRPGQASVVQALPVGPMHVSTSPSLLSWASDWATAVITVPSASPGAEIGFRLWSPGGSCVAIRAMLVIDSIGSQ
jgi:hypothetical protein